MILYSLRKEAKFKMLVNASNLLSSNLLGSNLICSCKYGPKISIASWTILKAVEKFFSVNILKNKVEFIFTIVFSSEFRVGQRDTCSWKSQLDRTRSWKVQNETGKIEVGKFEPELESSWRSWKERGEVGKFELKLDSSG